MAVHGLKASFRSTFTKTIKQAHARHLSIQGVRGSGALDTENGGAAVQVSTAPFRVQVDRKFAGRQTGRTPVRLSSSPPELY